MTPVETQASPATLARLDAQTMTFAALKRYADACVGYGNGQIAEQEVDTRRKDVREQILALVDAARQEGRANG